MFRLEVDQREEDGVRFMKKARCRCAQKRTFFPSLPHSCFGIGFAFLVTTFRDYKGPDGKLSAQFLSGSEPSPKAKWYLQIHFVSCFLDVTIKTVPSFLLTGIATQTVLDLMCARDASLIKSYSLTVLSYLPCDDVLEAWLNSMLCLSFPIAVTLEETVGDDASSVDEIPVVRLLTVVSDSNPLEQGFFPSMSLDMLPYPSSSISLSCGGDDDMDVVVAMVDGVEGIAGVMAPTNDSGTAPIVPMSALRVLLDSFERYTFKKERPMNGFAEG